MKAQEIRALRLSVAAKTISSDLSANVQDCAAFLQEIAAQLAELNEHMVKIANPILTRVEIKNYADQHKYGFGEEGLK